MDPVVVMGQCWNDAVRGVRIIAGAGDYYKPVNGITDNISVIDGFARQPHTASAIYMKILATTRYFKPMKLRYFPSFDILEDI